MHIRIKDKICTSISNTGCSLAQTLLCSSGAADISLRLISFVRHVPLICLNTWKLMGLDYRISSWMKLLFTVALCVLCVKIILLIYSCCVPAVKLTKKKSASTRSAADGADESLRFYFLEREVEKEKDGEMKMGINMRI